MPGDAMSDSRVIELQDRIKEFEASRGTSKETPLSEWIRANRSLLEVAGSLTVAVGEAIAWIVTHVEEIQQFVDALGRGFNAPLGIPALDLDAVQIFGEPLTEVFPDDDLLFRAVVKHVAATNAYERVISKNRDLDLLVEEL